MGAVGTFVYFTQYPDGHRAIDRGGRAARRGLGDSASAYAFVDDPNGAARSSSTEDDRRHRIDLGWTSVGAIRFDLTWPRGASLTVHLVQFGLVTYVGSLRYVIELERTVDSNVTFERNKDRGGPTFVGGAGSIPSERDAGSCQASRRSPAGGVHERHALGQRGWMRDDPQSRRSWVEA